MYLALFSFHLSPKLAITLSMLPEAGAISYFDWFRTLNRLELSAHDMYDAGLLGASIGPCQLFVYFTTISFCMNVQEVRHYFSGCQRVEFSMCQKRSIN